MDYSNMKRQQTSAQVFALVIRAFGHSSIRTPAKRVSAELNSCLLLYKSVLATGPAAAALWLAKRRTVGGRVCIDLT